MEEGRSPQHTTQQNTTGGKHYEKRKKRQLLQAFTMLINGVNYYFIARLGSKGICLMFNKSEEAVEHFEMLEKQKENEK